MPLKKVLMLIEEYLEMWILCVPHENRGIGMKYIGRGKLEILQ
ncbi:hypothetical protein JMUB7504_27310 [Staphylococcus aureus]